MLSKITDRKKLILKAIVEEFVRTNEPVGSKDLVSTDRFGLGNVSSATIRNDMMEMELDGLIAKTHLSSGRVPTEEGYRIYVKEILKNNNDDIKFPMIDEIFDRNEISKVEAIKESMALVTNLTNYASIVMGTSSYLSRIKKLQFVKIDDHHGIILMVTDHGYVESKKILLPENIDAKDMEKVVNFLDDKLYNCQISEIENTIKESINEENIYSYMNYYDELVGALIKTFTEMAKDKYFMAGQSNILNQPEFRDIEKVQEIFRAIERQEIFRTVSKNETGITVRIGSDNTIKAMENCTMISVPYEISDDEFGVIAILGPTRMEYRKIIPLLEYISKNIKKVM